jgi:hypothetical protein
MHHNLCPSVLRLQGFKTYPQNASFDNWYQLRERPELLRITWEIDSQYVNLQLNMYNWIPSNQLYAPSKNEKNKIKMSILEFIILNLHRIWEQNILNSKELYE